METKRVPPQPASSTLYRGLLATAVLALPFIALNPVWAQEQQVMVRISEIQVDARHLAQYKAILKEEAEASVRLEPGVIAIFPMYLQDSEAEVRILEMYANRAAYESHLGTPHFQKYKSGTRHMVKSLKLLDVQAIDPKTMASMFRRMERR